MSNVINLADFRKTQVKPVDMRELCQFCSDEISDNWARAAKINRLNEYFVDTVPTWAKPNIDYLSDLNAISTIEEKIKLPLILRAPQDGVIGWVAGFKLQDQVIETAPIYFTEAYARCFNILLFLKIKREIKN